MVEARLIDTNVLIVASAADESSPFQPEATPVEESKYREQVFAWLSAFFDDPERHAILDCNWLIMDEYSNKLAVNHPQDFGFLMMLAKQDRGEVVWVDFEVDQDNHAILPESLAPAITDLADRKMVAAVLDANQQGNSSRLVNACDTDWLDCAAALEAHGVAVENLIPQWLHAAWQRKKA